MSANMSLMQSQGQTPAIQVPTTAQSLEAIKSNFGVLQMAMESVLRKDVHFGVIPGTGQNAKPTLLKPGADVICSLFHLSPSYVYQITDLGNGHREYLSTCTMADITGRVLGQGVGLASTMETKYRFRKADAQCPECGARTIRKGSQQYGGGWFCGKNTGGCGAKFKPGDTRIENQDMGRIEHDNPADYYNTCLKMAAKRSQVAAVLTVTGASAVFTQDMEDFKDNVIDAEFEAGPPMAAEDKAPPLPSEKESLAQLAKKCGLADKSDIALLNRFVRETAKAQNKPIDALAAASLMHFDSFTKAFKPWFEKEVEKKAKKNNPEQAPAPVAPEGEDITPSTLQAIEKELTRLGAPGQLPPEIATEYDTGDPSELTEAQGQQALIFLQGTKD